MIQLSSDEDDDYRQDREDSIDTGGCTMWRKDVELREQGEGEEGDSSNEDDNNRQDREDSTDTGG